MFSHQSDISSAYNCDSICFFLLSVSNVYLHIILIVRSTLLRKDHMETNLKISVITEELKSSTVVRFTFVRYASEIMNVKYAQYIILLFFL